MACRAGYGVAVSNGDFAAANVGKSVVIDVPVLADA
jgi:hypothetical protein